jgi:hypothetical protein
MSPFSGAAQLKDTCSWFLRLGLCLFTSVCTAETTAISLSQEQDGGDAGRACIYVYQGKAEYRIVKPGELCAPQITIDTQRG